MDGVKGIRLTVKMSGNGFRIPEDHRPMYDHVLEICRKKHNGFATITVEPPRRRRSTGKNSQSAHFNGHIQQIAVETGQVFGDIKEYAKTRAIDQGYPMLKKDDGAPFLNVWGQPRGISEADASVEDAIILIDTIHQLAAELDIRLVEE